jgi:hypothetical protein
MASKDRPGPAFVALRAATLGIDDLSRQALRAWVSDAIDHRGERIAEHDDPAEEATRTIRSWLPDPDGGRTHRVSPLVSPVDGFYRPDYHAPGASAAP